MPNGPYYGGDRTDSVEANSGQDADNVPEGTFPPLSHFLADEIFESVIKSDGDGVGGNDGGEVGGYDGYRG